MCTALPHINVLPAPTVALEIENDDVAASEDLIEDEVGDVYPLDKLKSIVNLAG